MRYTFRGNRADLVFGFKSGQDITPSKQTRDLGSVVHPDCFAQFPLRKTTIIRQL